MAVIEDVGLFSNPHQAAVIVAAVVHGLLCGLVGIDADIVVAADDALVHKAFVRIFTDSVGQFMHDNGGIDEIIEVSVFADGGGFEEFVAFITGTFALFDQGKFYEESYIRLKELVKNAEQTTQRTSIWGTSANEYKSVRDFLDDDD